MSLSRRGFLTAGAAFAGAMAGLDPTRRLSFGQIVAHEEPVSIAPPAPKTPAAIALKNQIGDAQWTELFARLNKTNSDVKLKGLKTIDGKPNAGGDFLTGYVLDGNACSVQASGNTVQFT